MDRRSIATFPWEPDPGIRHRKSQREFMVMVRFHLNFQSYFTFVGEFDGVPDQVHDHLAQSAGISRTTSGTRGPPRTEVPGLFVGPYRQRLQGVSRQSRRLKSIASRSIFPASIFEKSRMSFDDRQQRICRHFHRFQVLTLLRHKLCVQRRSVMPITRSKECGFRGSCWPGIRSSRGWQLQPPPSP